MLTKRGAVMAMAATIAVAAAVVGRGQDQSGQSAQQPVGAAAVMVMNQPTPQTKLESMLATRGAIIVRGYTDAGTVQADDGSAFSVAAIELTDVSRGQKEYGLAIGVKQAHSGVTVISYLDADEIDAFAGALDYLGKMDSTVTPLTAYEGRFRSKADLEAANFADSNGTRTIALKGMQVFPETGQVFFATAYFPLARLSDVKQLITTGKQMLEKARAVTR